MTAIADPPVQRQYRPMSYRGRTERNWGSLIASVIAVPLVLGWFVIVFVGGSMVCADPDAHCEPTVGQFLVGAIVIVAAALALGWTINRVVGLASRIGSTEE